MEIIATIKSSQIFQAQYIIYLMNLIKDVIPVIGQQVLFSFMTYHRICN
jgi:hypothetical protein